MTSLSYLHLLQCFYNLLEVAFGFHDEISTLLEQLNESWFEEQLVDDSSEYFLTFKSTEDSMQIW